MPGENSTVRPQRPASQSQPPVVNVSPAAGFALGVGGILLFVSLAEITGALGTSQVLNMSDPVFNVPVRYLMLTLATMSLPVACLCLFTQRTKLGLMLALWVAVNFIVYRLGLWSMGLRHTSGFLISPLGLSLPVTDRLMCASAIGVLLAGVAGLWLGKPRKARVEMFKMACPACGTHIQFASPNLGRKIPCPQCQVTITLRKPDLLKMACFFCHEHIEFPAHAIGEKMPCPHCKMDITLKEPA
jgi:hypothetical protein